MKKYLLLLLLTSLALPAFAQSTNAPSGIGTVVLPSDLAAFASQCAALLKANDRPGLWALAQSKITGPYVTPVVPADSLNNNAIEQIGTLTLYINGAQAAHDYYVAKQDYSKAADLSVHQLKNPAQAVTEEGEAISACQAVTAPSYTNGRDTWLYTEQCRLVLYKVRAGTIGNDAVTAFAASAPNPMPGMAALALWQAYDPKAAGTVAAKAFAQSLITSVKGMTGDDATGVSGIGSSLAKLNLQATIGQ